jgi:hypothetical protein
VLRRQMRGWGEGPSRRNIRDANDAFEGLKVGRLGRIEGSLRLTISSGRQRAQRGVAPPVLGIFALRFPALTGWAKLWRAYGALY